MIIYIPKDILTHIFSYAHWESYNSILKTQKIFNESLIISDRARKYYELKKNPKILTSFTDLETEELGMVLVRAFPSNVEYIKNKTKNIISEVVRNNIYCLRYIPDELKDRDIATAAISYDGDALKYLPLNMRSDAGLVSMAIKKKGTALYYAAQTIRANRKVVMCAIKNDPKSLFFAASNLQKDKDIAMTTVRKCGAYLKEFPMYNDYKPIVLAAVKNFPEALQYASDKLKDDDEIAEKVREKDLRALRYASKRIKEKYKIYF